MSAHHTQWHHSEITPRLAGPLRQLFELEVARGNVPVEVSVSWPLPRYNVWLARPFGEDYRARFPTLSYQLVDDPHHWLDEYSDESLGMMIAVRTQPPTTP